MLPSKKNPSVRAALSVIAGGVLGALCLTANAQTLKSNYEAKKAPMITIPGDQSLDTNGAAASFVSSSGSYLLGFEGISQYDGASFGRNFIPPDTMGAVGLTQYVATTNGGYAVFDKNTGNRLTLTSDVAFWAAAGQTGTNGDTRIMYNATASRWVAVAFGQSVADLQIAVSNTDNALGAWQSVKFSGFAGGTADYPTLALDTNAVYIGTNNFKVGCSPTNPAANAFCGTTLNVIPLDSLFNAGAPTTAAMKQFVTPNLRLPTDIDAGFAIQGVNSSTAGGTGTVIANSLFFNDNVGYRVNGLTPGSALGSSTTAADYLGIAPMTDAGPARQPSAAIAANRRVIDSLDQRISSSVYESNGRIYMVQTVNSFLDGLDQARIRYTVIDATTFAILDEGDIGSAGFDYYQGSIAVNSKGQVVIGYNRSGLSQLDENGDGVADGVISFLVRTFDTDFDGNLVSTGDEILLKTSLTDDYHNGSLFGAAAAGRQRWGDYSQVSIDPEDTSHFWVIGEFAREYNLPQFGHPGGTGGSRWGTWIAEIDAGADLFIPEPTGLALMLMALAACGAARRARGTRDGRTLVH